MKIYSVITARGQQAELSLSAFVEQAQAVGATGITLFTRPSCVAGVMPPNTRSVTELERDADAAAARKDYKTAAEITVKVEETKVAMQRAALAGADWIKARVEPVKSITQLIVLGNAQWPANDFSVPLFLGKIEEISNILLTAGINGMVQKTPLVERTFIPQPLTPTSQVIGHAVQGEPARGYEESMISPHETPGDLPPLQPPAHPPSQGTVGPVSPSVSTVGLVSPGVTTSGVPTPVPPDETDGGVPSQKSTATFVRHASIPQALSQNQARFATLRLGLDRGGLRRSRNEAGNMLGYSPAISARLEGGITSVWAAFPSIINDGGEIMKKEVAL